MISCIAITSTAIYTINKSKEYDPELYTQVYNEYKNIENENYSDIMNIDKELINIIV